MANIAVLSLNPALDVTYKIQKLIDDEKIHSFETRFDPGGNGINVGRAFKRLKVKAATCCVLAGKIGTLMSDILINELDDPHFIWEEGETRINCIIQQSDPVSQYEINGMGPAMSASVLDKMEKELYTYSKDGFAVLTGSPPLNITNDIYNILCSRLKNAGIKCLVDADGALLHNAVKAKPYIIKPNIHELERLVKRNLDSVNEIAEAAKELHNYGIEYVFISIGHKGAILASKEGVFYGAAPEVPVMSGVGAGDSMVAGILSAIYNGGSSEDSLKLGIACGTATVQMPGTELFTMDIVDNIIKDIYIEKLNI
ncbi:MAG: 1-phosphofructokinase family hexose kinase [Candidatus Acidulodesulfobacterium sp.]